MRLHFPVDLTGNLIMIEKLLLGEIRTGDLPIFNPDALTSAPSRQAHLAGLTLAGLTLAGLNSDLECCFCFSFSGLHDLVLQGSQMDQVHRCECINFFNFNHVM